MYETATKAAPGWDQSLYALFMQAPSAVAVVHGTDQVYTFANPLYQTVFGRTQDQLIGRSIRDVWPELDGQGVFELFEQVYQTGLPYTAQEYEVHFLNENVLKQGYYQFALQPIKNTTGLVTDIMIQALDITRQVLARQKAQEQQEDLYYTVELNPQVPWTADKDGNIDSFSERWLALTGLTQEQAMGEGWLEAPHPDDKPAMVAAWMHSIQTGEPYDIEHRIRLYNGTYAWMRSRAFARRDRGGSIVKWYGTTEDIDDRRRALLALKQSEERFVAAISAVQGILWTNSADGKMMGPQPGWAALTGQCLEEYQGYGWANVVHPDDAQPTVIAWTEAVEQRKPFIFEHRLKQKDGRWGQFSIRAIPTLNADGSVREWVGVHTDVTQQRQAEAALWESQQRFRTLAETLPNMVWSLRPDLSPQYVNPQVLEYVGLSLEAFQQLDYRTIFHPDEREHVIQTVRQEMQEGQPFSIELRLRRHDGAYRWFLAKGSPSVHADGEVYGYVGSCIDIQQQKVFTDQLEQNVADRTRELVKANEALIRSNEYLQQFAYVASHDLQEPLRKIQTFGGLLMDQYVDELGEGAGYLERITAAAGRMAALIRDLLNYSRISTQGSYQKPVSLNAVVDAVLTDLELVITETGAEITVQTLPTILGDSQQLGQLMQNLLSNALKFRRLDKAGVPVKPVVAVSYERVAATDLPASVNPIRQADAYHRIDVVDNGIGFEEKYADRIFEVFQRLHGKRAYPGTGIGLAICEKVVANHGGGISARSQPGRGATFHIYLPESIPLPQPDL